MELGKNRLAVIAVIGMMIAVSGCATLRHPVPPDLVTKVQVRNMPEVRVMSGEHHTLLQENILTSVKQERPGDFPLTSDGTKIYPILAISGGGANGAYGAGLLKGWSKEGSRPVFKIVTGVSTGAIIAPFAFLGRDYDEMLEKCYTTMSTKNVMANRCPLTILFSDSLATNQPLAKTIAGMVDAALLEKIAAEHNRGRRLFVGTTNLDAQRFVVWDMGAIACRGDVQLFRKVILASAAIPVIFPPSIFTVEANGATYDEMHVDGGTLTQVFALYKLVEGMQGAARELGIDPAKIKGKMYIIRNGYVSPSYKKVNDSLPALAERSFDTIIGSQGIGDTYRIYTFMQQRGNDYNLAFIPSDCVPHSKEMFDPAVMRQLFDRGYADAAGGYPWHKTPPGFDTAQAVPAHTLKESQEK